MVENVPKEIMLPLYTEFERITAETLCLERNRDEPNEQDLNDAVAMCVRWNQKRIKMGMRAWQ
jgi:hypothetical protein